MEKLILNRLKVVLVEKDITGRKLATQLGKTEAGCRFKRAIYLNENQKRLTL
jgi:DNA-binding Xre family transcriptional regulator